MKLKKTALALCLLSTVATQPATAAEERISVHEIHSFFAQANSALNNPNVIVGRNFLVRNVSEGALFETSLRTFQSGHPVLGDVAWNRAYGAYYYRYPYAYYPYYSTTSYQEMGKWEMISNFESKKRLIVGYQPDFVVTGIKMRADASQAMVDLDLKEYSARYAPYSMYLTTGVLHANSKCKAYFGKSQGQLLMSRMDCNTHSDMPL